MVVKKAVAQPETKHPSLELSIGSDDQIEQLSKLQPVFLLNQQNETPELVSLRTNYKYLFVINWLYNFRGFIKLQSETFDVDLFELELLNYFHTSYQDDQSPQNQTFLDKLKLLLMSSAQGSKLSSLNNFEKVFRLWFGYNTPLGGKDHDEEDDEAEGYEAGEAEEDGPSFDSLSITDKIEILYIMIAYISSYHPFRSWVDRSNIPLDSLRMNSLCSESKTSGSSSFQEDYVLMFECNRLYKRTIHYNSLVIPKKRKLSPAYPDEHYDPEQFDISPDIKFELIYKNIYEFDEILKDYGKKKSTTFKTLVTKLSKKQIIESIFSSEIRKRRFLAGKRREMQLASLLATRKRSSRLEAKEKQRQEELRLQKLQEEEELKLAAEKRFERRMKLKQSQSFETTPAPDTSLTREERLKMRKLEAEKHKQSTPEQDSKADVPATTSDPSKPIEPSTGASAEISNEASNETSNQAVKELAEASNTSITESIAETSEAAPLFSTNSVSDSTIKGSKAYPVTEKSTSSTEPVESGIPVPATSAEVVQKEEHPQV